MEPGETDGATDRIRLFTGSPSKSEVLDVADLREQRAALHAARQDLHAATVHLPGVQHAIRRRGQQPVAGLVEFREIDRSIRPELEREADWLDVTMPEGVISYRDRPRC